MANTININKESEALNCLVLLKNDLSSIYSNILRRYDSGILPRIPQEDLGLLNKLCKAEFSAEIRDDLVQLKDYIFLYYQHAFSDENLAIQISLLILKLEAAIANKKLSIIRNSIDDFRDFFTDDEMTNPRIREAYRILGQAYRITQS